MKHPQAIIDPHAKLANDVSVGPFTIIGPDVEIASGTEIGSHTIIEGNTRIGERNRIGHHVVIGAPPQDLKYNNEVTFLEIGNENIIREFATVHRGTPGGGGVTRVGNKCMIMAYAHIAHDCQIGDQVILANAVTMAGHVSIGNFAIIGGLCAIHQFVKIGEYAFIGGLTGVAQDVVPFGLIAGVRGQLKGINAVGLRRHGFNPERRKALHKAVRMMVSGELNMSHVLEKLGDEFGDNADIQVLIDFIRNSDRGICLR